LGIHQTTNAWEDSILARYSCHQENNESGQSQLLCIRAEQYNKKTARVDDPRDLITRVDCFPGEKAPRPQVELGLSARRQSMSVDQVTWIIHEGDFLFIIYHNCKKVVPFGESWDYIHHYFAKIKADFATWAMTIRYVG
jgi:hypothetical protein